MLYGLGPFSFLIKSEKIISRLNGPVFQIKLFKTLILKLNFKTFLVKPNNDLHAFARCTYNLALFKTEIFNYFSVEEESLSALSRYIQHIKRIMARSRRAVTQDPATSGEAAATATLDQSQGMEYGIKLLEQARSVFIQEGNNIVRERVAKLYKEEKEVGAKAQDLERQAKELRTEEAKKKEERAGAEREVDKSEENIARVKETLQDIEAIMACYN